MIRLLADCTEGSIRIAPSSSYSKLIGWVEVCLNGVWGGVCSDFFNDSDATVVCRQLGYTPIGIVLHIVAIRIVVLSYIGSLAIDRYYYESLPYHLIDVNCTGNESTILNCPSNGLLGQYNCPSWHYATVACHSKPELL